jgi:hypothetical protein
MLQREHLQLLFRDYEMAASEIRVIVGATDRLLAIGLGAVGAGVSYGLVASKSEIFLVLPVLLASLFIYATLNHHNIAWLGGYRRFLEDRMNHLCGEKVLIWEHVVAERGNWNVINIALLSSIVLIGVVVCWLSLKIVFESFPHHYGYSVSAIVAVSIVFLAAALVAWRHASSRSYSIATRLFDGRLPYKTSLVAREVNRATDESVIASDTAL